MNDAAYVKLGRVLINGIAYMRPVITVAKIRFDGGAACVVPVDDLIEMIKDGQEYTVRIEDMGVKQFERLEEFNGW